MGVDVWNGISTGTKPQPMTDDWWYEDVSFLSLPLYKRLIQAVEAGGMSSENISGALVFYAKKYVPLMNRQSSLKDVTHVKSGSTLSEADQRALLEEIVELLPKQKGVTETRFLLRLLPVSPCIMEESQLMESSQSLASITRVANLVDSYLAEVAPDVNFKFPKFQSLAAAVPEYARPISDGIYRAIDIYLKAHPWLTDIEREQICRLMNCQKLLLEASTHAAQNERLPVKQSNIHVIYTEYTSVYITYISLDLMKQWAVPAGHRIGPLSARLYISK
ncbi:hypothetical protein RND71_038827 [Anisodus tanguticus]|uniref:NPH3 domain-containing protein n=1 Tax=Anisodus tanguticus TaxID=243964 RepID=A0AAE1R0Z7_9SOLA|nr:hypothetical protein RND71_038827 [Anisodus tanguticus]